MKRAIVVIVAAGVCSGAAGAQVETGPRGSWVGAVVFRSPAGAEPMPISLELRGGRAVVGLGRGHAAETHVAVRVSGRRVRFAIPGRPGYLAFDGRLRRGRLTGTVRNRAARGGFSLPASAFVRMRVWSRGQQGEQGDGDEVAERGLWPANFRSTVEPGGVDEEDDGCDHHLAEPANDEDERREKDAPEAQLRKAHCGCKVEHVPSDPENQRTDQDRCGECRESNGKPAGDKGADPKDAKHDAEDWTHTSSL
jgi:hypothetical protein